MEHLGITPTRGSTCTGANVTGISNGTTYTFTVHATNGIGNSPESAPSNAVNRRQICAAGCIRYRQRAGIGEPGANPTYAIKVNNSATSTIPDAVLWTLAHYRWSHVLL